ncbi:MAG: hypothetical protein JWO50_433 [Candidatus Kaiserbacteria bacterium]|nr:hypothetical protein [Candidatus Kaiserbacteria bacterium]
MSRAIFVILSVTISLIFVYIGSIAGAGAWPRHDGTVPLAVGFCSLWGGGFFLASLMYETEIKSKSEDDDFFMRACFYWFSLIPFSFSYGCMTLPFETFNPDFLPFFASPWIIFEFLALLPTALLVRRIFKDRPSR